MGKQEKFRLNEDPVAGSIIFDLKKTQNAATPYIYGPEYLLKLIEEKERELDPEPPPVRRAELEKYICGYQDRLHEFEVFPTYTIMQSLPHVRTYTAHEILIRGMISINILHSGKIADVMARIRKELRHLLLHEYLLDMRIEEMFQELVEKYATQGTSDILYEDVRTDILAINEQFGLTALD